MSDRVGAAPRGGMTAGRGKVRLRAWHVALAAVLVGALVGSVALPRGDDGGAPSDHAVRLVPADALVYVHATLERGSEQLDRATELVRRVPFLARLRGRLARSFTPAGRAVDVERELDSWVGDEVGLALLGGEDGTQTDTARSLILLEVADRELARSFLSRVAVKPTTTSYRGTPVRIYGDLATAFLGDFLAVGRLENLRAAIDVRARRAAPLARARAFRRARGELPDENRLLYAYASPEGLRRLLEPRSDLLGPIARLADEPALEASAASLRVDDKGVRIDYAGALDRALSRRTRKQEAAKRFSPELLGVVSGDAIGYLGMRGADRLLRAVASFSGGTALRLPPELRVFETVLGGSGGARVIRRFEPLLQEEAALFVSHSGALPVITLIVADVGDREADALLAGLQPLITRLLRQPLSIGQVPTFEPVQIAGVDAATLKINPTLELTYAAFDGRAVVSTSPGGIRRVKVAKSRIDDNPLFAPGLRKDLDQVTSVVFLDLEQLLALGEQAGLGETSGYAALKSDLGRIKAVSAVTDTEEAAKKAEIFIEVQ